MKKRRNQMKNTRSESTSIATGIGETLVEAIGHGESIAISEGYSDDSLCRGVSDARLQPRASSWSGEPRESVTILIEGGGFSFNDVFPMDSRVIAAENGRAIATFALSLVAPRRRRSSGRTVEA
jgi:hypothetical protein